MLYSQNTSDVLHVAKDMLQRIRARRQARLPDVIMVSMTELELLVQYVSTQHEKESDSGT